MTAVWLASHWSTLLAEFAPPAALQQQAGADLLARYADPARAYHNLDHLQHVLTTIDRLVALTEQPTAVRLAAWFHDAIYDPRAADNEERSATLARQCLPALGVAPSVVEQVERLILLTKTHIVDAHDSDGQVLLDADLAILGATPAAYDRYAAAIRQEYAWVSAEAYRAGRAAVLRRFLERPRIYQTAVMLAECEAAARENLEREVFSSQPRPLGSGGQPTAP